MGLSPDFIARRAKPGVFTQFKVRNSTGSDMVVGAPVYISGWHHGTLAYEVTLADADAVGRAADGVLQSPIATGSTGIAVRSQILVVPTFDSSGGTAGDAVYLGTTAGTYSLSAVGIKQVVGYVDVASATVGAVAFNIGGVQGSAVDILATDNTWLGTQDISRTVTAADQLINADLTMNHASAVGIAIDAAAIQATTNRTSGTMTAVKGSVTSLSGDTSGVDYYAFEAAVTVGEANADHFAFKVGAGFDAAIDSSSCATGENDWLVPANVAAALVVRGASLDYLTLKTTTATPNWASALALTAAGNGWDIDATINHASGALIGLDVSAAQITTVRTSGTVSGIKAAVTSLSGDTAGVDYYAYEAAVTVGEAGADHFAFKVGAGFDKTIDASACATTEGGVMLPANIAAAWTVGTSALTFEVYKTTTATPGIDWTYALTGAEQALHLTTTANLASGAISGITSQIATVTTNHTSGVIAAFKASTTSLSGDTGGDFCAMHIVAVDGGGTTPVHSGVYCDDPLDAFLKVAATGDGSVVVGNMTAKNPESDTEAGYFSILVGSTRYEVPMYAVA